MKETLKLGCQAERNDCL